MTDQQTPSPREVAEATVEYDPPFTGGQGTEFAGDWHVLGKRFQDESSARAALATAQKRKGVYARKPEWSCGCVQFEVSAEHLRHGEPLTPTDRPWLWCYDPSCTRCVCGVPKTAAGYVDPQTGKGAANGANACVSSPGTPGVEAELDALREKSAVADSIAQRYPYFWKRELAAIRDAKGAKP